MSRKTMYIDPYLKVISEFNRRKIYYLVVGVSGINYYVRSSNQVISTADYDIFIKPDITNVTQAIKIMRSLHYDIVTAEGPIERDDKTKIENIVKKRNTLICENPDHNIVELCLEVSGFTFEELDKHKKLFKAGKTKIAVAGLKDMLKMKEVANRPKDRLFLQKYSQLLKE